MAPFQDQETDAIAGITLQEPDYDAIYIICLIDWVFSNKLADMLDIKQLKL